ncbi:MAG: hypothetical protein J2P28_14090 [Actinobacteria bacterium]|nr:hypothetical protein [Actinomycetota bacterium]MBO0836621.1 hypothetical protein [Actinomycetota bacterium]
MSSRPLTFLIPPDSPLPKGLEELCEEFVTVCESAVHPLEIAGALEADGWTDQALRKQFGVSDVFTVAEEMYRRVPRRPVQRRPQLDAWRASRWRPAVHGLLYGIPAVCFAAAAGLLTGGHARAVFIVALLVSWTLSQGLAYLGYLRLGQGVPAQAERILLAGLGIGVAAVLAAMFTVSLLAPARTPVLMFGVALGLYMQAATVMLVLGAERQLFLALAPGVLGATAFLLLGRPLYLEHATWAVLAATPLAAFGLALARTIRAARIRGRSRTPAAKREKLLSVAEICAALPSAGFGLVAGGLLVFPIAVAKPGHGAGIAALLASLPLSLSMGAAEWILGWFRHRTQRAMRSTHKLRAFASRSRLLLAAAALQYLVVTLLLTVAVVAVATIGRVLPFQWPALPQIATYLALGCSLFVSMLLNAFGSRIIPVAAGAAALAIEVICQIFGIDGQIVVCIALLTVLGAYATTVLGSAARHAY